MVINNIEELCKSHNAVFLKNEILAQYTTFKIGGACDTLVKANSRELLCDMIKCCKTQNIPYHIIGRGSNILVSDNGVKGVVILLGEEFSSVFVNDCIISCEAGAPLMKVCREAYENSLSGLEFAFGIPASVGGAVYMNAGAYGGEIKDIIISCEYLDENCDVKKVSCSQEEFSYRKSPFTKTRKVVLSAEFKLEKSDKNLIKEKMDDFSARRKSKQPLEFPSAGSTFKRPEGDYASRLIDVCGLKGFSFGGAQVSEKHAGFIINKGGASCNDVLGLIEVVKERVFKQTGIMLEREVEIIE